MLHKNVLHKYKIYYHSNYILGLISLNICYILLKAYFFNRLKSADYVIKLRSGKTKSPFRNENISKDMCLIKVYISEIN